MTVRELIKELSKYPEDLDVRFYTGKWEQLIQTVDFEADWYGTGKGVVFLEGDF
jgi:hypothetical protein